MIDEIDKLLERISSISTELYRNSLVDIADEMDGIFFEISQLLLRFIEDGIVYKEKGIDVPQDILIAQLKNFMDAFEKKDVLMLADSLKYEIYEGLGYYREILTNTVD